MSSSDRQRRAPLSCDTCRMRKIKCLRLEDGSCKRCVSVNRPCVTTNTRSARPYYQTSKEQFELMAVVVRHFLPGVSLEKDDLRHAVAAFENQALPNTIPAVEQPGVGQAQGNHKDAEAGGTEEDEDGEEQPREDEQGGTAEQGGEEVYGGQFGDEEQCPDEEQGEQGADQGREEDGGKEQGGNPSQVQAQHGQLRGAQIAQLQRQIEQLQRQIDYPQPLASSLEIIASPPQSVSHEAVVFHDTMNIPRFDSGSSWPAFLSKIHSSLASSHGGLLHSQPYIVDEFCDGHRVDAAYPTHFPTRDQVQQAATKFFSEINNVIYIMSYEQFQQHLDNIYQYNLPTSNSVILLMGLVISLDEKFEDHFAKACQHFDMTLEEACLESVQGLMLLGLCRLNRNQRNLASVVVGCGLKIAQSLGLHLHESTWKEESPLRIEGKKRLWWSLYDLEVMIACNLGRPSGIYDDQCGVSLCSNSEFFISPYIPPGYSVASSSLSIILSYTIRHVYLQAPGVGLSEAGTSSLLGRLRDWWGNLPEYLRPGCPTAPSNLRAISYLSLRYHYIIMLVNRSHLLSSVATQGPYSPQVSTFIEACEDANRNSISLLKDMAKAGLLSRFNFFDCLYILVDGMVLFLRALKSPSLGIIEEMEDFLHLFPLTDHLNIGKFGVSSFKALLHDLKFICHQPGPQTPASLDNDALGSVLQIDGALEEFWDSANLLGLGYPNDFGMNTSMVGL